jgi:4-phospho-D-threonate 3-dehydrogenase / 4-phospho-D-erythronate 3-dehydrogenase
MGDPAGIGGEVILKASGVLSRTSIPVIVGDLPVLEDLAARLFKDRAFPIRPFGSGTAGDIEIFDVGALGRVQFGLSDARCGEASYRYIIEALRLLFCGAVSAIVTCPINKKSIRAAGLPFVGHTELLAHYGGVTDYVMMMTARRLRVSLVTIHVPLREVPSLIEPERVFRCLALTDRSLKNDFGLPTPRIKVCGLNPHAGEQGVMGTEEEAITEAIQRARKAGMNVDGPYPADSLFHKTDCDAYVAMYHDQGLIPVKTVAFSRTVNVTVGLPFVRTSVGHGTGLDIAGIGLADPTSLVEAYRTAESMVGARSKSLP